MPKLAEEVSITNRSIKIDGEEFPWYVAPEGITVKKDKDITTVTFTVPCQKVLIDVEGFKEDV